MANTKITVIEKILKAVAKQVPDYDLELIPTIHDVANADVVVKTQTKFIETILAEIAPKQETVIDENTLLLMNEILDEAIKQGVDAAFDVEHNEISFGGVYNDYTSQDFDVQINNGKIVLVHYNSNYGTRTVETDPSSNYDYIKDSYADFTPESVVRVIKMTIDNLKKIEKLYDEIPIANVD